MCVPRVPVGNTENYRVCRSQSADFAQVPVRQGTAVFSAEIARNSLAKTASLTVFFSGNFNVFHGTGTDQKSMTCQAEMRGAREKHHVSTGTLGTQIKPTPARTDASLRNGNLRVAGNILVCLAM
jgi:hypothetical protein